MSSNARLLANSHSSSDEDDSPKRALATTSIKLDLKGLTDDDSGLPSSYKTVRGVPSVSSLEDDRDGEREMEERGVFDYVPAKRRPREEEGGGGEGRRENSCQLKAGGGGGGGEPAVVVVRHALNPQYDEAVNVDDNESLESPRSDTSSTREYDLNPGTEMSTFRSHCGDCVIDMDSDGEEGRHINVHKSLYSMRKDCGSGMTTTTTSTTTTSMVEERWMGWERPRASSTSSIHFPRTSRHLDKEQSISSSFRSSVAHSAAVDDSISFGLSRKGPSRHSPDYLLQSPPFGTGDNLLQRVGSSVSSLLPSYNMHSAGAAQAEGKKKKKKKKDAKGRRRFFF
jgi:hypothetical protein